MVCDVVLEASVRKMILKGIVIVTCDGDDERAMAMELQVTSPVFGFCCMRGYDIIVGAQQPS
jgi:hypothetical protein